MPSPQGSKSRCGETIATVTITVTTIVTAGVKARVIDVIAAAQCDLGAFEPPPITLPHFHAIVRVRVSFRVTVTVRVGVRIRVRVRVRVGIRVRVRVSRGGRVTVTVRIQTRDCAFRTASILSPGVPQVSQQAHDTEKTW